MPKWKVRCRKLERFMGPMCHKNFVKPVMPKWKFVLRKMWGTKCALIDFDIRNSFETVMGAFDDETAVLGCTVRVTDIAPVYPIDR